MTFFKIPTPISTLAPKDLRYSEKIAPDKSTLSEVSTREPCWPIEQDCFLHFCKTMNKMQYRSIQFDSEQFHISP